ncbi:outer membrane beta-barrel protein [Aquimarina muelleri]|uniref:Outer membrane protein beta-barrel domain-containing protein n=1 Tax=Aquimarina muelleri TaxID=279356 RepID=A0A918K0R5_9FLAO|nr:outer membrane beta-barrel protein [Aquimarina muelleri]MCX2764176.1 PorT family protein [Aquimarina muelleri]GGX31699.1 hypothetical protein GCM10007384_35890 [Aquimarina muelleri]
MKYQLLFILLSLIIINSKAFSQTKYEKGYFIDNAGVKTECFIKNKDWLYNPSEINYKISKDSTNKTLLISQIKEFSIAENSKYRRFEVNVNQYKKNIKKLDYNKEPKFLKKTVLLKYLIDGKASLYMYQENNQKQYFYSIDNDSIMPLVYKEYKMSNTQIAKNKKYHQQLWNDVKHNNSKISDVQKNEYTKKDLAKHFNIYNSENKEESFIDYTKKSNKNLFNLSIRPGIEITSFSVTNISTGKQTDFDNNLGVRLGLEAEFILPFNNNKWSFFIEPTYHHSKTEAKDIQYFQILALGITKVTNAKFSYQSLQIPIGLRYGFFIKNNSKIFINAAYSRNINFNSKIESSDENSLDIKGKSSDTFVLGVGYKYKDKYSIEARLPSKSNFFESSSWNSNYQSPSIIFGYRIF